MLFKNFVDPAAIVILFTITSLINRKSRRSLVDSSRPEEELPLNRDDLIVEKRSCDIRSLLSRFLATFPFLIEIWYWNLTYWIYQLARAYSAYLIREDKTVNERAENNAMQILHFEKFLHIDIEKGFQQYILREQPWLMSVFSLVYQMHIIVGILFLCYLYTYIPAAIYQRIRRTIAMDNLIAFIIFTSWRCTPPRMIKGYEDILHGRASSDWSENRFRLTLAAMPSLHFGTSALIGYCLFNFAPKRHRILRIMGPIYPLLMLATIIATANHWVLDAVVGVLVPVLSWRLQWQLLRLLPLEALGFRVLGIEKPKHTDPS